MKKRKHKVLIVDDEKQISSSLGRVLKKNGIEFVCCESGEEGLKELSSTAFPFSLIISDQRMPGMTGSEFLEKAKEMTPSTVRFLISGYSDNDVLIDAINRGIIQKFIHKPWDITDLVNTVKKGFKRFNNAYENERLVKVTRKQNKKLYQLDCDLNDKVKKHKQKLEKLDQKIILLKKDVGKRTNIGDINGSFSPDYIEKWFEKNGFLEKSKFNSIFQDTLYELFDQFNNIAQKNGFEMPTID